jgi:hypothetical protein
VSPAEPEGVVDERSARAAAALPPSSARAIRWWRPQSCSMRRDQLAVQATRLAHVGQACRRNTSKAATT